MMTIKRVIKIAAAAAAVICCITVLPGCAPLQTSPTDTPEQENISYPQYKVNLSSEIIGAFSTVIIEFNIDMPKCPETVPVYQTIQPNITEEYVKSLGIKFGLNGNVIYGDDVISMDDDDTDGYLMVFKATGTILYTINDAILYPSKPADLPSDEEAMNIAMNILSEKSILPKGDLPSKITAATGTGCGECCHLLVSFNHVIPIAGPGAKHGVRIGDGGEVIEVFINPTNPLELPVLETVPVKSGEQAFEEMKANKCFFIPYASQTARVQIDNVYIAYWLEGVSISQEYIVPVYVFKGKCFDMSGNLLEGNFTGYIEAIKTE